MKGLILAGGSGTRLRPLTHTGPKQLIPIANKPIILYGLEDLREAGIRDIGVILGYNMPEKVRELLGDGSEYNVNITYIEQGEPKGIAHAVLCAKEFMQNEPFVVYLGDNVLKGGIKDLVRDFEEKKADAAIALCKVPDPQRFGVAEVDKNGNVIKTVEKPKKPKSDLAVIGIYLFRKTVFPIIENLKPSWRNELEITDTISGLIEKGYNVQSHIVTDWWKDTGKPEDILEVNRLILDDLKSYNKGIVKERSVTQGRVGIEEGTIIEDGCTVRGPAIIGKNCKIAKNAYIGPYTTIGDNCTISSCEIESSIIMNNTIIDANKKIVDSLIGSHSKIIGNNNQLPKGYRFVLGENSSINL